MTQHYLSDEQIAAERADIASLGAFFHRFDGEEHVCVPITHWRQRSATIAAYAAQQAAHPATGGAEAVSDPGSQRQRRIDNDLLALIQRHFPNLPTSDEYTNWSQWLGFARAVYALASPAVKEAPAVVPAGDAVRTLAEQIDLMVRLFGSLRRMSEMLGIDVGYLSRLRSGEKTDPSDEILKTLGLRRVVTYEPIYRATPLTPRTKSA